MSDTRAANQPELRRAIARIARARNGRNRDEISLALGLLVERTLDTLLKEQVDAELRKAETAKVLNQARRAPSLGDLARIYVACAKSVGSLPPVDADLLQLVTALRNHAAHPLDAPPPEVDPGAVYSEKVRPWLLDHRVVTAEEVTTAENEGAALAGAPFVEVHNRLDRVSQENALLPAAYRARTDQRSALAIWIEGDTRQGVLRYHERLELYLRNESMPIEHVIAGHQGTGVRWERRTTSDLGRLRSLLESLGKALGVGGQPASPLALEGQVDVAWNGWLDELAKILAQRVVCDRTLVRHVVTAHDRVRRGDRRVLTRYLDLVWSRTRTLLEHQGVRRVCVVLTFEFERSPRLHGGRLGTWLPLWRRFIAWRAAAIEGEIQRAVVARAAALGLEPVPLPRLTSVPEADIVRELERHKLGDGDELREMARRIWEESDGGHFEIAVDEIEKALPRRRGVS